MDSSKPVVRQARNPNGTVYLSNALRRGFAPLPLVTTLPDEPASAQLRAASILEPADAYTGSPGDDVQTGTSSSDTFNLSQGGDDTASGLGGNDVFTLGGALTAADHIDGGSGNDTVTLNGDYTGANAVAMNATTMVGVETLTVATGHSYAITTDDATVAAGQILTVNAPSLGISNTMTFDGSAETDGSFVVQTAWGADTLVGGAGADTLRPGNGSDHVSGNGGDDSISFTGGRFDAGDFIDGGSGTDLVWLNGDYSGANAVVMTATTLTNVETISLGAGFNYSLTTADATVGAGKQLLLDASGLGASNALSFNGSAETNGGFQVIGGSGADTMTGGSGNDSLSGRAGDDTITPGAGTDVVDGGDGSDTVNYAAASGNVQVDLSLTTITQLIGADQGRDLLRSIENVIGSDYDDRLLGSVLNNILDGGNGNDQLYGYGGNDTLIGGNGDDHLECWSGNNVIRPGDGNDYVGSGDGNDTISFTGGSLNAADRIYGVNGNDTIWLNSDYTGANAVVFTHFTVVDVETIALAVGYSYDLNTGDDLLFATSRVMTINASNLGLSDSLTFNGVGSTKASFLVIGGAGIDTIVGSNGADTLSGRAGNDTLSPGLGNDMVAGGDGDDTINFTDGRLNTDDIVDGGAGVDSVYLNGDYAGANAVNFYTTTITNVESIGLAAGFSYTLKSADATVASGKTLTVDASALGATNTLTFNGAAETNGTFIFISGSGGDVLTGGTGADVFRYDAAGRSTGLHYDTINALNFANDSFDIPGGAGVVSAIDAALGTGTLSTGSFDGDLTAALSGLGAHHAMLFTPNAGTLSGQTFMVIDCNGTAGYQAGQDLVIRLNGYSGTLTAGGFH